MASAKDITDMVGAGECDPSSITILHLSDFHFESDTGPRESPERVKVYESMLLTLEKLIDERNTNEPGREYVDDWSPDVVVVSGDIAYSGADSEYSDAAAYIGRLLDLLQLGPSALVMCPGNHDRNIDTAAGIGYPANASECDTWLRPNSATHAGELKTIAAAFREYAEFCAAVGSMQPSGLPGLEYLTGVCSFDYRDFVVEFFVLNSAWFATRGGFDMRRLWLGLPLIEALDAITKSDHADPSNAVRDTKRLRIGLCHHPREWLHPEEHDSYSDRPNTFRAFAERCDLMFHGNVQGALEPPTLAYSALTFTGGATYSGGRYRNKLSLVKVDLQDNSARRRGFEYDPTRRSWQESTGAAGTFQLFTRNPIVPPDLSITTLVGSWRSVFWQELLPSVRRTYDDIVLVEGEREKQFISDNTRHNSPLALTGELSEGFFSGVWNNRDDGRSGAFQLKVMPGGEQLVGRWVGFDSRADVLVGHWRFRKSDQSDGGRDVLVPSPDAVLPSELDPAVGRAKMFVPPPATQDG